MTLQVEKNELSFYMMPTKQIESHLKANMNMSKRQIMIANFLGGLSWGFGTVIGATVVAALLISILQALGVFDPLKDILNLQSYTR